MRAVVKVKLMERNQDIICYDINLGERGLAESEDLMRKVKELKQEWTLAYEQCYLNKITNANL